MKIIQNQMNYPNWLAKKQENKIKKRKRKGKKKENKGKN